MFWVACLSYLVDTLTPLPPYLDIFIHRASYVCFTFTENLIYHKSDPSFAEKIRHVRDPKKRMAIVWSHCKTKTICEADDPKEDGENPEGEEPKKGHGGCGHAQPQIRKEGLKLFVQYKRRKDDDEVCDPSPF